MKKRLKKKMKKLTAAIAAVPLASSAAPAFASDATSASAVARMTALGIVKGDQAGSLMLDKPLTRAEMITTLVRSQGGETAAVAARGAKPFKDIAGTEWYSGWIAEAKRMAAEKGFALGRGGDIFDPQGQLSRAEALVFTMKYMGITVAPPATGNWFDPWVNEAVQRGMITAAEGDEIRATADTKVTRNEAFALLDKGYAFEYEPGKSFYTSFVDPVKPELTLTVPATTTDATISLDGTVCDNKGVASVTVNGTAVTVTGGAFTTDVALDEGTNTITVVVTDLAGNATTESFRVARTAVAAAAVPASIDAADFTVAASGTFDLAVTVRDADGSAITDATVTGTSDLGTFADGIFTAGATAGTGTLTLTAGDVTKQVAVTVTPAATAAVPASIDVADFAVDDGGTFTPTIVVRDANGTVIPDAVVTGTSTIGTFAGGIFTHTARAGSGTLTLTAGDVTKDVAVTVTAAAATTTTATPATIEAADFTVADGGTQTLAIVVRDANGDVISDAVVTGTSTVGTFADGVFTHTAGAGSGTLTLTSGDITHDVTVTVEAAAAPGT